MTPRELEALIADATAADVLRATRGLPEKDRRPLAPTALRLAQQYAREERTAMHEYWADPRNPDAKARIWEQAARARLDVAGAALLALGSPSDLARHERALWDRDRAFDVLSERRPPWLTGWAEKVVAKSTRFWDLSYRLVMAGLCHRPTSESWCLGFLAHRNAGGATAVVSGVIGPDAHLRDRAFVDNELWRLFKIEGNSELSFANIDRWTRGDTWSAALLAASRNAKGGVPRARLLDATLEALQRDFIQYRARWFADLHRALKPTVPERVARVDRYLALLGSAIAPTVSFALEALEEIEHAGELTASEALPRLAPAAQARTKKTALAALAMAERAAEREPALAGKASEVAAEVLAHEMVDVQARAIKLVARFGDRKDAEFVARVREVATATAATLRAKVLEWLGPDAPTAVALSVEGPPASAAPPPAPQASPLRRAASLDEAIDLLSGAIERYEVPDEMEAALDGVARFCGERPADFAARIAPLGKRAAALADRMNRIPFAGYDLRGDLCRLALAWSEARPPEPVGNERWMRTFLAGRISEVAVRAAAARPATLLGTPTHEDGWIDPEILVARAAALQAPPDPLDAMQSLLRIARDGRPSALAGAAQVAGEYGRALRFALGGDRPSEAPENDLWLAAEAGRTSDNCAPRFDLLRHPMTMHVGDNNRATTLNETLTMRWVVTVFPPDLQSYFRAGGSALISNLDWDQALWWNAVYLEPLLHPDIPLERNARRLLAVALAAKSPAEGGLAVDALIRAVEDRRADADALGDTFAALLSAKHINPGETTLSALRADKLLGATIKCARWAKRLQEAARASSRHAAFVRDLVERALRGLPSPPPADLGPLLALLRELCVETAKPLRDPEARAKLDGLGGEGTAARLARALLAT